MGNNLTAVMYFSTADYSNVFSISLSILAAGFLCPLIIYYLAKMEVNIFQACTEVSLIFCSTVKDLLPLGKHTCKTKKEKRGCANRFIWDK